MSGFGSIKFDVDTKAVEQAIDRFPGIVYERTRSFVFRCFLDHRETWLKLKQSGRNGRSTRWGRGGRGIKVHRVGEGPPTPGPKDVIYHVGGPRRVSSNSEARQQLRAFDAFIGTGNIVLEVHEFGKTIAPGKLMELPVSTRPGDPTKWRAKYPNRKLIERRSRTKPGVVLLFEVKEYKSRARRAKVGRYKWTLRFALLPRVKNRPTLKFYETWNELDPLRQQKWSETLTRIAAEIAAATTTSNANHP